MGVVKLADYRPQLEVVEHRVADTEDGFMRVANEITDSLLMADLTVRQMKVMLAIMRKTYGFNKPMDRLTNTQIAAMTGIHHTHVCAAKRQLIERKFLIADGVKIGVNKVVSQWISQDSLTLAKTANKTLAKSANGYKPSQLNTKDNIQKTINTNTPLPPNGGGDGQVKPERRKAERIDYESFLNAYNTEVGDRLPHAVAVNEKRKRRLKKIIPQLKTPNVDGFRAYVRAFVHQAKPFYFGDNDTGWTADFDYLLREDSLTGVREATETDDDESEQEFYFGDEKLDSPTSEDSAEHGLVKHLRKTIKEKDRELKELMRQSQKPVEQQPVITQPPRMPKLDDEDIGFDEEIYQQRMAKWAEDNGKYQQQEMARKQKEQELQAAYQERLSKYQQRVKALKVPGYQEAEQAVLEEIPIKTQNAILFESEKPEIVVLALGRNAELRKQLAEATNPVAIGRLLERIESKARIMPKAKTTAATTPTVKGSNGAVINNLDKLKAKALETGDWTPYFAAKKAKK